MSTIPPSRPLSSLGGRYALREPLGEGSFAVTYLAEDLVLGRLVAVKVLRTRHGSDSAATARFEREARAAAAVTSPYLVDVFDYGTDQGVPYIVLQYVAGSTLRDLIDRSGRLVPREAARIAGDILRGLAVLHEAGIVHRDVKPHNILIDRGGAARVTDFGVALWAGMEHLTSHGLAVGTAVYMAPEQATGAGVGPAADLYAVGVLLFEMLTGQPPFQADHPAALMLAHVRDTPPLPSELTPGLVLPMPLEREVMRALAKEPGGRHSSAVEMAAALEAAVAVDLARPAVVPLGLDGTTQTVPALGDGGNEGRQTATSVAPTIRGAPGLRGRAWLAPLALLAVALAILVAFTFRGGFDGLTDLMLPDEKPNEAAMVVATATVADAIAPAPTATPAAEPPATEASVATIAPAQGSGRDLFPIAQTAGSDRSETATVPAPTVPATSTPPPVVTEAPPTIASAPDLGAAGDAEAESGASSQALVTFGPNDWQGVPAADPELGRPAVALYGADGAAGRATLQFELPSAPTTAMILSLTGLGDETGQPFPFGLEINGIFIDQGTASFDNWHPARDGLNGEQAVWDEVRFALPPEFFHAGLNEISVMSLSPGDYDDRWPYLLLSEATLSPRDE